MVQNSQYKRDKGVSALGMVNALRVWRSGLSLTAAPPNTDLAYANTCSVHWGQTRGEGQDGRNMRSKGTDKLTIKHTDNWTARASVTEASNSNQLITTQTVNRLAKASMPVAANPDQIAFSIIFENPQMSTPFNSEGLPSLSELNQGQPLATSSSPKLKRNSRKSSLEDFDNSRTVLEESSFEEAQTNTPLQLQH